MSKELMSALEKALRDKPQLKEQPAEDISQELLRGGYLQQEPSPGKVAQVLGTLKVREQNMREQNSEHGEGGA